MGLTAADIVDGGPESFSRLGEALDGLETEAQLRQEAEMTPEDAARVKSCRTYLYLLGYLVKDTGEPRADPPLLDATRTFQRDAGLTGTAQLDESTWAALKDLCQFQSPCPVDRYFSAGAAMPALRRAVQLRLFSLGLVKDIHSHRELAKRKQARAAKKLQQGLDSFRQLAMLLGLSDKPLVADIDTDTARLLLHHDELVQRLQTGAEGGFRLGPHAAATGLSNSAIKSLVSNFIKNLALVELWLLGYPVRPGQFKPDGADLRFGDDTLAKAMKKFCTDRGLKDRIKTLRRVAVGPWFFEEARKVQREADACEQADLEPEVIEQLESNRKFQRKLANKYSSLGSRIFDGIKRIFGWFKYAVKKAFNFLKRSLGNIARMLKRGALKVYEKIRAVVTAVKLGFQFYAQPVFPGSDPGAVYVRHDRDLDFDVFVNARCPPARAELFFDRLSLRTELFEIACRIVGKLLDLSIAVFKLARPVVGWLGLLITLVRLGRWLQGLRDLAGVSAERLDQLSDIRAVESSFSN